MAVALRYSCGSRPKKKGFTAAVTVPKDIMLLLLLWQHIQSVEDGGS